MNNKLGINNTNRIREIEYYIFNIKYSLIDENYTFNVDSIFTLKYLECLHDFLFGDIYDKNICKIRQNIKDKEIEEINILLNKIKDCVYNNDINKLKDIIYKIWEKQIFYDGNTRTLLCFLKVIKKGFNLDIEYDFNKKIDKDCFIYELIDGIKIKQKVLE